MEQRFPPEEGVGEIEMAGKGAAEDWRTGRRLQRRLQMDTSVAF